MRTEFREGVRAARAARSARPRQRAPPQDASLRPRAVAKLMFMHMMGYPTHFGQMECLKLISAASFGEKARSARARAPAASGQPAHASLFRVRSGRAIWA